MVDGALFVHIHDCRFDSMGKRSHALRQLVHGAVPCFVLAVPACGRIYEIQEQYMDGMEATDIAYSRYCIDFGGRMSVHETSDFQETLYIFHE